MGAIIAVVVLIFAFLAVLGKVAVDPYLLILGLAFAVILDGLPVGRWFGR